MKAFELSVAGKTFLAGEYLALTGGPALLLATEPKFQLNIQSGSVSQNPFHPQSPAGIFWDSKKEFFSQYTMSFKDPYQIGGFGASSAQFALLHAFWQLQEAADVESERFYDWHSMLKDYRSLPAQGLPPSGADLMGAVSGGITYFDRNNGKIQTFAWPFSEIEFFVAHTGQKLATHEHLKNLGNFETQGFEKAMQEIHQALIQLNFENLLKGLNAYRAELEKQGRVAEHTQKLVSSLEKHSDILFLKGCGAMGSDVIVAFCRKEKSAAVQALLEQHNLKVMANSSQIASSLQIRNLSISAQELSL